MRASFCMFSILYAMCTSVLPVSGVIISSKRTNLESRLLKANTSRQRNEKSNQANAGRPIWSVALPILSMSLLSWFLKRGSRCCTYDDEIVLDDIIPCKFGADEGEEAQIEPDNTEDIELQNVSPPDRLTKAIITATDPVDTVSIVSYSYTDSSQRNDPNDSSFNWMLHGTDPNSTYMNY